MKWFLEETHNICGKKRIVFSAMLDTPVYIYQLGTRWNLHEQIKAFDAKHYKGILSEKDLEELCWKIDCLREGDKFFNNLGKEKVYLKFHKTFDYPVLKYVPYSSYINSSVIGFCDGNGRRNWLNYYEKIDKSSISEDILMESSKIIYNFPSDKTLIRKIIDWYLNHFTSHTIKYSYEFNEYINIYYTFCHEPRRRSSSSDDARYSLN